MLRSINSMLTGFAKVLGMKTCGNLPSETPGPEVLLPAPGCVLPGLGAVFWPISCAPSNSCKVILPLLHLRAEAFRLFFDRSHVPRIIFLVCLYCSERDDQQKMEPTLGIFYNYTLRATKAKKHKRTYHSLGAKITRDPREDCWQLFRRL